MTAKKKRLSLLLALPLLLGLLPIHALAGVPAGDIPSVAAEDRAVGRKTGFSDLPEAIALTSANSEDISSLSTAPPNSIASIFPDPALAQAVAARFVYNTGVPATVNTRVTQTDLDALTVLAAPGRYSKPPGDAVFKRSG